jgi:hypothetical protein
MAADRQEAAQYCYRRLSDQPSKGRNQVVSYPCRKPFWVIFTGSAGDVTVFSMRHACRTSILSLDRLYNMLQVPDDLVVGGEDEDNNDIRR